MVHTHLQLLRYACVVQLVTGEELRQVPGKVRIVHRKGQTVCEIVDQLLLVFLFGCAKNVRKKKITTSRVCGVSAITSQTARQPPEHASKVYNSLHFVDSGGDEGGAAAGNGGNARRPMILQDDWLHL